MCKSVQECSCENAVRRVYNELRDRRISDTAAFDAAANVYRLHHPGVAPRDARYAVAEWLDDHA